MELHPRAQKPLQRPNSRPTSNPTPHARNRRLPPVFWPGGAIKRMVRALDDHETRIVLLGRSAIEAKQSQRDYIQGLAVGFIGAALFFMILLLLISIYHR